MSVISAIYFVVGSPCCFYIAMIRRSLLQIQSFLAGVPYIVVGYRYCLPFSFPIPRVDGYDTLNPINFKTSIMACHFCFI